MNEIPSGDIPEIQGNAFRRFTAGFRSARVERYALYLLAMMLFGLAHGLFIGVQDNYLAWLGIGKTGRGVVEFFREMPGLLLILVLAAFSRMAERNIIRISLMFSAAGIAGIWLSGSAVVPAVFFLTLMSLGDHLVMPVRQSYAIHAAVPGKEGRALGFMRGLENGGQVLGLAIVPLIFGLSAVVRDQDAGGRRGYVLVFAAAISFLVLGMVAALGMAKSGGSLERKRLYFNRKYNKYYGLEVFYGARKQVFLTFAPYLMILNYDAGPEYIASLLLVCALINIGFNPLIGRIIDRLGYRVVMIGDTIILFFVCLIYGFAGRLFSHQTAFAVISIAFVVDMMLSNAAMAASVYVGRISDNKEEMTSTLSTGISINHLVSVGIALLGGVIWEYVGVETLFSLAALMAVGNTIFAITVPRVKQRTLGTGSSG